MDPETQQYIDVAKTTIDVAHKTGMLRRIFALLPSRKSERQHEEPVDHRERALITLRENAVETIAGLELTAGEALRILGPNFSLDDMDKVNSTWQRHWTVGASRVGIDDEERRNWWARLLAGEIEQPEIFSLRTLAVIDTMSTKEAQLFSRVCDYVWDPADPCLILSKNESGHWKPDFAEAAVLESIGLVKFNSVSGFNVTARDATKSVEMMLKDRAFLISDPAGESVKLRCGPLLLTDVGKGMYRLTTPNYLLSYCDEIVEEWRKSYTVKQVSIVT